MMGLVMRYRFIDLRDTIISLVFFIGSLKIAKDGLLFLLIWLVNRGILVNADSDYPSGCLGSEGRIFIFLLQFFKALRCLVLCSFWVVNWLHRASNVVVLWLNLYIDYSLLFCNNRWDWGIILLYVIIYCLKVQWRLLPMWILVILFIFFDFISLISFLFSYLI